MLTHLGQGASMSIEDAGVLGVVMEGVSEAKDVQDRLALWEDLRWKRASGAQLMSRTVSLNFNRAEETLEKLKAFMREEEIPSKSKSNP
jgi:salicylate hydroxylase